MLSVKMTKINLSKKRKIISAAILLLSTYMFEERLKRNEFESNILSIIYISKYFINFVIKSSKKINRQIKIKFNNILKL